MTDTEDGFVLTCPAEGRPDETVQMAHGGGGRTMANLIASIIRPAFDDAQLERQHDGAALSLKGPTAFTTDSYVVSPLMFPGGDIGKLAIFGTANDLAMCGAKPLFLSIGLILEEGLPLDVLRSIVGSMSEAARTADVRLVTGDTKVVERGKADGMFINTAGLGQILTSRPVEPASVRPGDVVILSGDIGRHGMAVMAAREGFGFETEIESDCAPLAGPAVALIDAGIDVRCMRDLTRGGLASALVEIAETAGLEVTVDETAVPVQPSVKAACELLGLDPFHVANEGRFVAFVAPRDCQRALDVLWRFETTNGAVVLGEVRDGPNGKVVCRGALGVERIIDMLRGEQLPRIC